MREPPPLDTVYYFGCKSAEEIGHYLFSPGMDSGSPWHPKRWEDVIPWGHKIDGGLCPDGPQTEGVIAYTHNEHWHNQTPEHWSAISWWDRSADKRGASNCSFLINIHISAAGLLILARATYPTVFARMKYRLLVPDEDHVWREELTKS